MRGNGDAIAPQTIMTMCLDERKCKDAKCLGKKTKKVNMNELAPHLMVSGWGLPDNFIHHSRND